MGEDSVKFSTSDAGSSDARIAHIGRASHLAPAVVDIGWSSNFSFLLLFFSLISCVVSFFNLTD